MQKWFTLLQAVTLIQATYLEVFFHRLAQSSPDFLLLAEQQPVFQRWESNQSSRERLHTFLQVPGNKLAMQMYKNFE